jgi:hypothetical protein
MGLCEMHIVYLNLYSDKNFNDPESFFTASYLPHQTFLKLSMAHTHSISVVQRATFNAKRTLEKVDYYFINDEFDLILRWWQEPVKVFEHISEMQPDIIQVRGLDLPLQFRWLRREVGTKIKIAGEHTGETIWANRNLWLQQFGLRVVDGFIFKNMKDAFAWTKSSVILDKQPITEIKFSTKHPEAAANSLLKFYNTL